MRNRLRRLLPHAAILICDMYIVFFLIDRVNTAMNFIDNRLTKGLLLALCVVSWFNCRTLLRLASRPERPPQSPRSAYGYDRPARDDRPVRRGYGDPDAPRRRGTYESGYGAPPRRYDERRSASVYGERRSSAGYGERRSSAGYDERRYSTSRTNEGRYR